MIGIQTRVETDKNAAQAVSEGVREAMLDAATRGFNVSQERAPVDRGTLLQSGVPPTVQEDGSVVWGYQAEHARYLEEGTAPHWPPIGPLKGWARRVLGDAGAAYGVQAKIARQGTEPQPYVQPGIDAMVASLRARGLSGSVEDNLDG